MKQLHMKLVLITVLSLLLAACQQVGLPEAPGVELEQPATEEEAVTLTLASHNSFSISENIITAFEEEHNVSIQFLELGDAGEALNRIILSRDAPLADVFFGVDNTFLSRALDADIFVPYQSPMLDAIPDELELDPEHRLLPVDYGFVNINADRNWFAEQEIPIPTTLEDLTDPMYDGLLVAPNPATSSPGLAFVLATIGHFGEENWVTFWEGLRENNVLITSGWSEAYYEHFTVGSAGQGNRPLVVSYSTSPPADVLFAEDDRTEPASVNVNPDDGTFRQIEFVGVLRGTEHPELARALVDYMLGLTFQEDIPLQMFVYPANENAELPELFVQFAEVPENPADVSPAAIEANREQWIETWTDVMLR